MGEGCGALVEEGVTEGGVVDLEGDEVQDPTSAANTSAGKSAPLTSGRMGNRLRYSAALSTTIPGPL